MTSVADKVEVLLPGAGTELPKEQLQGGQQLLAVCDGSLLFAWDSGASELRAINLSNTTDARSQVSGV